MRIIRPFGTHDSLEVALQRKAPLWGLFFYFSANFQASLDLLRNKKTGVSRLFFVAGTFEISNQFISDFHVIVELNSNIQI